MGASARRARWVPDGIDVAFGLMTDWMARVLRVLTEIQAILQNTPFEYRPNTEDNLLDHDSAYIRHPTFVDSGVAGNPRIGDYGSLGHHPRHPILSSRAKDFRLSTRPGIQDVP